MRIAWIGSGTSGLGVFLLEGLLKQGLKVDYYCSFEDIPERLQNTDNLTFVTTPRQWEWGKWYSRNSFLAFLSGTVARTKAYNRLCDKLIENHAQQPYDCVFQFSQTELFKLAQNLDKLPPVVIYPCSHAAGELYWHRRESAYALESENFLVHYITRAYYTYRVWVQKRQADKPALIIGPSWRFNQLMAADYNISPERQAVIYHPTKMQDRAAALAVDEASAHRTITNLLFISRISFRKGLEYIVELSHRLDDLAGQIQIDVIGGYTQWSDYRGHLKELNPKTARYRGELPHPEMMATYGSADILLVPSLYEPGPIVVSEALSRGLCVVGSDAVGSGEIVEGDCFRSFPSGDMDAFERQVRQLIADLKTNRRQELRQSAREQAQKHFAPDKIARDMIHLFKKVTLGKK
ncbi:glycosyltransferase family 4 protein [Tumidithrix elongata RA019]|uniref:Glycosyltransferase family 4 protein n=1 Tax=Tumidithrix elongata BACA0141 TaxID=2716417 RepID=A0AAW9QA24_9CYAN|nr:glycosyltransferase family 4 protein [Tumidithrix elongata RA019]